MKNYFNISDQIIDIAELTSALSDRTAGALSTFEGRVRDHNDGRSVTGLDYEVFAPLALSEGARILDEAVERFGIHAAHAVHRHGTLTIGDCAVWVGVTAAHRDDAFRACRYIIDALKHRLPIWKKEHYADGTAEWVNCQHAAAPDHTHHRHEQPPALAEADFYARQIRLPEIGAAGQAKLKAARVLIVGAGGLGSPAGLMLAAAGVGTIGIAEFDSLEASNLHRAGVLYEACRHRTIEINTRC